MPPSDPRPSPATKKPTSDSGVTAVLETADVSSVYSDGDSEAAPNDSEAASSAKEADEAAPKVGRPDKQHIYSEIGPGSGGEGLRRSTRARREPDRYTPG